MSIYLSSSSLLHGTLHHVAKRQLLVFKKVGGVAPEQA